MRQFYLRLIVFHSCSLLAMFTGSATQVHAEPNVTEQESPGWRLPKNALVRHLDLRVSPDHRWVCFFRNRRANEKPGIFAGTGVYVMFDTRTGHETSVEGLFGANRITGLASATGELRFSPSGKHMLVHAIPDPMTAGGRQVSCLFVVHLDSMRIRELATGTLVMGRWLGNAVVVSTLGLAGYQRVKLVNVEDASARDLALSGLVHACDPSGKFIVVEGNSLRGRQTAMGGAGKEKHLFAAKITGEVIKDLGPTRGATLENVKLSRQGKFITYRTVGFGKRSVRVASLHGDDERVTTTEAIPISVLDDGTCLMIEMKPSTSAVATSDYSGFSTPEHVVTRWYKTGRKERTRQQEGSVVAVFAQGRFAYFAELDEASVVKVTAQPLEALFGNDDVPKTDAGGRQ